MDTFTRYLRIGLLIGLFAIPFIPFYVADSMYFPFITGKNFLFRILIELLAGGVLILALRDPAYRPRFSWISMGVLALLAAATLATITSVDATKSFWSNFERMEGLVGMIHIALWFFVATILLSTEKLWERFLMTSVGASMLMGCFGLLQLWGVFTINQGGARLDGTFGNAIYLAVYMLFHVFLTLFLMFRWRGPRFMYSVYGLALLLQVVALYYTATRSATLGLIGGLAVTALGIALFDRERPQLRKWGIGVLVAIALLVVGFFAIRNVESVRHSPVLGRFATISSEETTVKARFMIWGMAFQGVAERPLTGWGQENFSFVFNKYYNPQMYGQEQWFDRAHNMFLDWLVAGGVIAFAAFLSLFLLAAWAFWRGTGIGTAERWVLIGLVAGYGFHSFFVFDNLMSSVYFFLLLALGHSLTRRGLPSSIVLTRPVEGGVFVGGASIAVVATLCAIYFFNIPAIATGHNLIDAISSGKMERNAAGELVQVQKDPKENLEAFKTVALNTPLGRQEAIEQLFQVTSALATNQNVDPQVKAGFVELTRERGSEMLKDRPNDARLELFYGAFLNQIGDYQGALAHLSHAHELSPKKQWILFETGINTFASSGNYPQAVALTREAFELAPEFDEARSFYSMALVLNGQVADADKLLMERYGTVIVNDGRLMRAYAIAGLNDRVVEIAKLRVAADPGNIQNMVSLAVSYKDAGRLEEGLVVLREAARLAPQYKDSLAQVAKELGGSL